MKLFFLPDVRRRVRRTLLCAAIALISTTCFAADLDQDQWRFITTVPIWAAGIEGDVTVRGRTADIDVSFDDLVDHLDASFALGFEARREKYGFFGNVGYMKFSADGQKRGIREDAELKFLVSDVGMAYRLLNTGGDRPFILEALGGLRYWYLETKLKASGPGGNVLVDSDNNLHLADPIVGLRGSQYLAPKWHLDFQADIGGFGISDDTSDLCWSAAGLIGYDATRWLGLSAGYRALATDAEGGSGSKKKGLDIIMHGLLLTAQFKF